MINLILIRLFADQLVGHLAELRASSELSIGESVALDRSIDINNSILQEINDAEASKPQPARRF